MQTTIIIPCYNEEKRLPLNAFLFFVKENKNVQFLFVNDGSKDNTLDLLKNISSQNECFLMLDLHKNVGKAEAVRQGILYAEEHFNSNYIGFWDADLATPLNEIERFIHCLKKNDYHNLKKLVVVLAEDLKKILKHYLN